MGNRGGNYFSSMLRRVGKVFPELSEKAIKHACNKISNKIRRGKFDCYGVEISRSPLDDNGYYHHFEVMVHGITVCVRVTVD
jgi:hypothetical protein